MILTVIIVVTFGQIDNAVEVDGDWVVFNFVSLVQSGGSIPTDSGPTPGRSIVDKQWCVANGDWDGTEATWKTYNNPTKDESFSLQPTQGTGPWKLRQLGSGRFPSPCSKTTDYSGGLCPLPASSPRQSTSGALESWHS